MPKPGRLELIEAYYRIKPVDDLDAACQRHDACWVWRGRADIDCNVQFNTALMSIHSKHRDVETAAKGTARSATSRRCANLARDLATSTYAMQSNFEYPFLDLLPIAGNVIVFPIALFYLTGTYIMNQQSDFYPRIGELCYSPE